MPCYQLRQEHTRKGYPFRLSMRPLSPSDIRQVTLALSAGPASESSSSPSHSIPFDEDRTLYSVQKWGSPDLVHLASARETVDIVGLGGARTLHDTIRVGKVTKLFAPDVVTFSAVTRRRVEDLDERRMQRHGYKNANFKRLPH